MNCRSWIVIVMFLFRLTVPFAFSQNFMDEYQLSGRVTEANGEMVLPYATVQLFDYQTKDLPVISCITDSVGWFKMPVPKVGSYILVISYIGKEPLKKKIDWTNTEDRDLGKIDMGSESLALQEIVVSATKPLVKIYPDKIEYNVVDDPDARTADLRRIFEKLPLVSLSEDNFLIRGNITPTYFINGKSSSLLAKDPLKVLKSIPANTIKRIEVITNPGVRYDGDNGGGIINIITFKKRVEGISGSVGTFVNTRGSFDATATVGTQIGNFSLSAMYGYTENNGFKVTKDISRINKQDKTNHLLVQSSQSKHAMDRSNTVLLESGWEPDSMNIVNLTFSYFDNRVRDKGSQNNVMWAKGGSQKYAFVNDKKSYFSWGNMDLSFDYQKKLRKQKGTFFFLYKFTDAPVENDDYFLMREAINYANPSQRSWQDAHSKEHTFQTDYVRDWQQKHFLNVGLKYIFRNNTNDSKYYIQDIPGEDWEYLASGQDVFKHRQQVIALYAEYTLNLGKWDFKAGVREEITKEKVEFIRDRLSDFQMDFQDFLPFGNITYRVGENASVGASYQSRIYRPGIGYLNPKTYYIDPSTIYYGNPDIESEQYHTVGLSYSNSLPKLSYNLQADYIFCNNSIQNYSGITDQHIYYTTYDNNGKSKKAAVSGFMSMQPFHFLRLSLNATGGYAHITGNDVGKQITNAGWTGNISSNMVFYLPCQYYLTLNGGYNFPQIQLQGKFFNFYYAGFRLSKSFFKDLLSISAEGNSIFWKHRRYTSRQHTDTWEVQTKMSNVGMSYGLSVTYRFNSFSPVLKKTAKKIYNEDVKGGGPGIQ